MIEEVLLQYGAMGALLAWFMFVQYKQNAQLNKSINNNTEAILGLKEMMKNDRRKPTGTTDTDPALNYY